MKFDHKIVAILSQFFKVSIASLYRLNPFFRTVVVLWS